MWRRGVVALILMVSVVAAGSLVAADRFTGGSAVFAATAAPAPGNCQNVQLAVSTQGSQGAAGTIVVIYRLHNLSGQACTLFGYPGVQLLDRQFQTVHTVVHRGLPVGSAIPKKLVSVVPHGNVYFTMLYNQVPVGNQPCEQASYLMVFPPNDFLPVVAYAAPHGGSISPCTGNLYVSPVTAQPRYP